MRSLGEPASPYNQTVSPPRNSENQNNKMMTVAEREEGGVVKEVEVEVEKDAEDGDYVVDIFMQSSDMGSSPNLAAEHVTDTAENNQESSLGISSNARDFEPHIPVVQVEGWVRAYVKKI